MGDLLYCPAEAVVIVYAIVVLGIGGYFEPACIITMALSLVAVRIRNLIDLTACIVRIMRISAIGVINVGESAERIIEVFRYKVIRINGVSIGVVCLSFSDGLFDVASGIVGGERYYVIDIVGTAGVGPATYLPSATNLIVFVLCNATFFSVPK